MLFGRRITVNTTQIATISDRDTHIVDAAIVTIEKILGHDQLYYTIKIGGAISSVICNAIPSWLNDSLSAAGLKNFIFADFANIRETQLFRR